MLNSGKYKQYLSIPEAALVWSGLPLDLLVDAAYPSPGVPLIVGYPDVTARAEALVEATTYGTLIDCSRMDPDIPLPSPDKRVVGRQALMNWIKTYWPEELPGARTFQKAQSVQEPIAAQLSQPEERLLTMDEVLQRVGFQKATLYRRMKAGTFPKQSHKSPNRWRLTEVQAYIERSTTFNAEDI